MPMVMEKKKSHSIDDDAQVKLKVLSDKVMERFDEILSCLNVELHKRPKMYVGKCPIHGGDKNNALNLYHTGDNYVGNWKCRTHQCHKSFVGSALGFIRGVLSHQRLGWSGPGDEMVSFPETLDFISDCLGESIGNIQVNTQLSEKNRFTSNVLNIYGKQPRVLKGISRTVFRSGLQIPSQYFINRGYKPEVLEKYDVGLCIDPRETYYNRVVAPIYDNNYEYIIGNTSRSIFDKCPVCGAWHSPRNKCPEKDVAYKFSKWKHSFGFKAEEHLYNYWFAKEHIKASHVAILVESPGNVWRLEEAGIYNSLGLFGSTLNDGQKRIIDGSGAMTLIVLMDNDEAGRTATEDIQRKCANGYQLVILNTEKNDVGDMTIEEVQRTICPVLSSHIEYWSSY